MGLLVGRIMESVLALQVDKNVGLIGDMAMTSRNKALRLSKRARPSPYPELAGDLVKQSAAVVYFRFRPFWESVCPIWLSPFERPQRWCLSAP